LFFQEVFGSSEFIIQTPSMPPVLTFAMLLVTS